MPGIALVAVLGTASLLGDGPAGPTPVWAAKITLLSTMLADRGVGEWGFSALVEADGKRLLFDTGAESDTVIRNLHSLGLDLSDVTEVVVLSHAHADHVGGLAALRGSGR